MAQWHAVIDKATGEARSFGTSVAEDLPAGLEAVPVDHQPGIGETWDAKTRAIVAAPLPVDALKAAYASAATVDQKLDVIAKRQGLV